MKIAELLLEGDNPMLTKLRKKLTKYANGYEAMGNQTMHGGKGSNEQKLAKAYLKRLDAGATVAELHAEFKAAEKAYKAKWLKWRDSVGGRGNEPKALDAEGWRVDAMRRLFGGIKP